MKAQRNSFALSILLLNLFLTFLGLSLVIPVMPAIMNELHISGTLVGMMVAAFSLTQLVASPLTGRWTDRFGRKIMILTGLSVFGISEILFGIGKNIGVLLISRIFGGFSAACNMPAVNAYIADITDLKERPRAFGYMSAAISTGFIVGPGIGGFLAGWGHRIPFFFAAGFAFLACILSILFLKEPERMRETNSSPGGKKGLGKVFSPLYLIPLLVIFIATFGLASFESLFSLYTDHKFGFDSGDIAIMITGGALIGALCQVGLFDRMTRWWGEISLVRYCLIFSIVLVFGMTVVNSYFSIMAVTFTVFVGFDLLRPAVTNYLSKIAGDEQGFVSGMNSMFTSIGNVFGPIVGGWLFDINLDYPFYFASLVLIVGLLLTVFWKVPQSEKAHLEAFTEPEGGA
jgi:Major Facilitator Superfamily.